MATSRVIVTAKSMVLAIAVAFMAIQQQLQVVESIRLLPSDPDCQRGLGLGMAESSESALVIPSSENLAGAHHGASSVAGHSRGAWTLHTQRLVNKAPPSPSGNPIHNR